jgi:hypothetical protein
MRTVPAPGALAALAAITLLACAGRSTPRRSDVDLTTTAESSNWLRTGRYDEMRRLCHDLARVYPSRARCDSYGTTPEGRDLLALAVSADGVLTPEAADRARRPVILVQAGIHAGEIEGKDAGFVLLRDILDGKTLPDSLAAVTVVFLPMVNPDGHERFGPNHRINQRGPEEMGFRTTAQNLNLNRDYVKADAPEMQALLRLFNRWNPLVYVDLHTTDGAKFEHDIAVILAPVGPRPDGLEKTAAALSDALQARITALGNLPLPFYPSFVANDDPATGFGIGDAPARFSTSYAAARDRLGILVETHSWRTYKERALSTRNMLVALLERAQTDAAAWRKATDDAAAAATRLGGTDVVLMSQGRPPGRTIEFRGYAYERKPSDLSGGTWTIYDEKQPQLWKVPLFDTLAPAVTVKAPRGGYLVPAAFATLVAPRLELHRVSYVRLERPLTVDDGQVFRADSVTYAPPFEGRTRANISGSWRPERVALGAGALWIPIGQPGARLALHLLEPAAPDSLAAWGMFNAVFEQKEYMEAYVAEEAGRAMLESDPALRTEYDAWLAADAKRAADASARLDFFYRRHPAWDAQKDRLPIVRTDTVPAEAVVP